MILTVGRLTLCLVLFLRGATLLGLAENKPLATITGKKDGKLIFAQVAVNGAGPFWFSVDTGASHSVIDPYVVQQAGLRKTGSGTTSGAGKVQFRWSERAP